MKEGIFFLLVILGLLCIAWKVQRQQYEGFQDKKEGEAATAAKPTPGELQIPLVSPRYQTLVEGEPKAFAPPSSSVLAPPPGQIASVNSLPAEDPALKKSSEGRLESVLQSVKGFLEREAPGLSQLGDPTVQLPLSTARSDLTRLESEVETLKRNPGLPSSLTEQDVNGIEANLGYLQRKWRQSADALSQGPMPPAAEGFCGGSGRGWFSWFFGSRAEGFQDGAETGTGTEASAVTTTSTSTDTGSPTTTGKSDVTLTDLKELKLKLSMEILRLQSSGTTDININARIRKLQEIDAAVAIILREVEEGRRLLADVPFTRDDIRNFLPTMMNTNTAIPNLITDAGLSDAVRSLFPEYATGDAEQARASQGLFKKYAQDIFNNLSWDVEFHYKGKAEQDIANAQAKAMQDAKLATEWSPTGKGLATPAPAGAGLGGDSAQNYRGFLQHVVDKVSGNGVDSEITINGEGAPALTAGGTQASGLDWKKRSLDICQQIQARGLQPYDFGCLENPEKVSAGFSWRGYARMVCNRLSTVYDPGVPELCGCPPPTWPGWRP